MPFAFLPQQEALALLDDRIESSNSNLCQGVQRIPKLSAIQGLLSSKAHQSNTPSRFPSALAGLAGSAGCSRTETWRTARCTGRHPLREVGVWATQTQLSSSTFQTQSRSRTCCYMSADSECS
uniref:Uncharacterized protein n=1 Tax=Pipistrellus kuhlii TaxID=59472 RepID=A0A7J7TLB1_PIPKU|nr:hypothetical protein mPipKuh1_009339 [Pipistrellus kuhlii]